MREDKTGRVAGIILAAGMSTRMGALKQLLPLGGRAAIEWSAEVVGRRLDQTVVVLGHRAEEIAPILAAYPVRWVVNADYQTGMLSSVQCGLRAVDTAADYLICLGDQPRLSGAVVEQVLQARKQVGAGHHHTHGQRKKGPSRIDPQRLPGGNSGIVAKHRIERGDPGPSRGYVRTACGRGRHFNGHGHASRLPARAGTSGQSKLWTTSSAEIVRRKGAGRANGFSFARVEHGLDSHE